MTPLELHRSLTRAAAFGDEETEHALRQGLRPSEHRIAEEHLRAAATVCLAHRFGEAAPERCPLDDFELGRFMAELRAAGPALRPPPNLLEVEAVVRSRYGEPHLLEEIGARQRREAEAFVLRYLTDSIPEIRDRFDAVLDRSRELQIRRILGGPARGECPARDGG